MRTQTGNPKRRKMNLVLCTAIGSLALTSCAADQNRMALLRSPPYFALNAGGEPGAVARQSGYFAERDGCVVFQPADGSPVFTPVFPKGETALVTDGFDWLGLYVKGTPVAMEKVYRLSGATALRGAGVALASPAPGDCPSNYFVVDTIANSIADGTASRFCAGVTICRAFGMD
jgi:hypothetical protein